MIDDFSEIERFFEGINDLFSSRVDIYVIGGAALMKRGMKAATKDIDIIVTGREEYLILQKALQEAGFKGQIPGKGYENMNLSQLFNKGDFRIDLFEKEVCGRFSLSEAMRIRSKNVIDLDNVKVHLCSNEDIFLFKTMTEREGDISDCMMIAKTQNPDWSIILSELKDQIKKSKRDVWITWVGERFDILVDKKVDIPIMEDINRLRNNYFDNLEMSQEHD